MFGLNSIPILFKFSTARDFANFEKPLLLTSSKHPLTVKVSKQAINVRAEMAALKKPPGIAGEAMLSAATPHDQLQLLSAGRRNLLINRAHTVAQRSIS